MVESEPVFLPHTSFVHYCGDAYNDNGHFVVATYLRSSQSHKDKLSMPGDLNLKKSWNPALVKNQKKVWEREQEALKEYQSIKQRSKEIAQEREKEELIRLQYGQDTSALPAKQRLELNKLGWMYEDVGAAKEPELNDSGFREVEEDFLLKKEEVDQLLKSSASLRKRPDSRFDQVTKVGSLKKSSALDDDPLLKIQREQIRKRSSHRERERSQSSYRKEESSSRGHRRDRSPSRSQRREKSPSRRHKYDETDTHRRGSLSRSYRESSSHLGEKGHHGQHKGSAGGVSYHLSTHIPAAREQVKPRAPNY